jgi:hypothetical protein
MRWFFLLGLVSGCYPLGEGDPEAAQEIVYSPDGQPAFAGQALVIQGCGGGAYCHANTVEEERDRYGAPSGLSFDLQLASFTSEVQADETNRLLRNHVRMFEMRVSVWAEVASDRMPPSGQAAIDYAADTSYIAWDRFEENGIDHEPLPGLDDPEGREILRNWLASGLPIVERTEARRDRQPNATGFTVASCERDCVDPTWRSIYDEVIRPTCTSARCHDADDAEADLDLITGSRDEVLGRMVNVFALGSRCAPSIIQAHFGQRYLIAPGNAEESLFYTKLAVESGSDVCGSRMPLGGAQLSPQRLCAIREWIECGACADESTDPACLACIVQARRSDECNIVLANDGDSNDICDDGEICCDTDGDGACDEESCARAQRCCDGDEDGTCEAGEVCCDAVCDVALPCPNHL